VRYASAWAVLSLLALVAIFYLRPDILRGTSALVGLDYEQLHIRRLAFAREALFGVRHVLPTWYPHEFLGSPFAANLQSFPWIPTRLLLLLLNPALAYAPGVFLAAALSALFTYLYSRQAGLTRMGAVAAGGTFACAGYFASRVMAGHLPLLEAYPALPLLLWLVDRALSPERERRRRFDLAMLALATACIAAAGHPQLPAYAVGAALLYTMWRSRGWLRARVAATILAGAGLALAVWWPMILLIGRSTRVLHLAPTDNDIVMPYERLLALLIPGIQGWPEPMKLAAAHSFDQYPNAAYFWDTAVYIGILPLVALAFLFFGAIVRKRIPEGRWGFLAFLGSMAFVGSLPLAGPLLHMLPGTLLRSPARLLYLTTFCVAMAVGAAFDGMQRRWPRSAPAWILLMTLHFVDLWGFAHVFVEARPVAQAAVPEFQEIIDREIGAGRVAEERDALLFSYADRYDDAGGFDSILLARFNRGILALAGFAPDTNMQEIDASQFPVKALEATGVRFVITADDLSRLASRTASCVLWNGSSCVCAGRDGCRAVRGRSSRQAVTPRTRCERAFERRNRRPL
jgi:hypothetical protein